MKTRKQTAILLEKLMGDTSFCLCSGTTSSIRIDSVCADSRKVVPGALFIAIAGGKDDGHDYITQAAAAGAAAVVINLEKKSDSAVGELKDCVVIAVNDTREVLGDIAAHFYGSPAERLTMIAVTGTNGKTTVSYLMEHVLAESGVRVGVIGTVSYRYYRDDGTLVSYPAPFTTPDPLVLHGVLEEMSGAGVTHVLMEVSSHALRQKRLGPIIFELAIFTNLSQDHLDYHHDMDDYFEAKCLLFREKMVTGGRVILCEPDAVNVQKKSWVEKLRFLCQELGLAVIRCGQSDDAQYRSAGLQMDKAGMSFTAVESDGAAYDVTSPLIGLFNSENLLAGVAALRALGLEPVDICRYLAGAHGAPGRMERVFLPVRNAKMPVVLVDYAHTPDALENVLATVADLPHRTLFCVFGCGGDRDRGKRPLMGEIAARYADVAIITDDNPRTEDPAGIRNDIIASEAIGRQRIRDLNWLAHRRQGERGCLEISGRSRAIAAAVFHGGTEDIVLIAGKGHETYQVTATGKSFFDDRLSAQEHSLAWDVELVAEATGGLS
ncbi:MAG: UDP-N-acetylmuramoyl-L-alanyl-D-glutamate--2,6-diaminopimelate ligase, partial [Desulfocapsaceae bacterium]|nr:UDP-N-acetylmuramoyl-L-alanyl-D-glutamate--2,6-diaminopimelate ligase [Desulfocapsaceae bacterium]